MDLFSTSSSSAIRNTISPIPSIPPMITGRSPPADTHGSYWKRDSSANAVSFAFIATAVFIALFLVVAIFERFRRRSSTPPGFLIHDEATNNTEAAQGQFSRKREGEHDLDKSYVAGLSVLMPGERIPTFVANPIPLSCSHEDISWPTHKQPNAGSCSFEASSIPSSLIRSDHEENGTGLV